MRNEFGTMARLALQFLCAVFFAGSLPRPRTLDVRGTLTTLVQAVENSSLCHSRIVLLGPLIQNNGGGAS